MEKTFTINGKEIKVQDYKHTADALSFTLNGKSYQYGVVARDQFELILENGHRIKAAVGSANRDGDRVVIADGKEAVVAVAGKKVKKAAGVVGGLTSPMPGKIFRVLKEAGSEVKRGEVILILEAMKMEHSIRSDKDGKVIKINYKVGELVQGGVTLAEVE
jgi:biotin carboxyl carrier protein